MHKTPTYHRQTSVRAAVSAVLGASLLLPVALQAADAGDSEIELEEIQVTGSRIVRKDATANAPVVTVGSEILGASSSGSLEVNLSKLPQFSAAETPTTEAGDIQPTATNTPGAATVALRGIGTNRNLVLIDGRRATPGNASMAVDLNTIPSAAIERVEVMSGGASSTYGADAVGGVVNLILKKNFEGLQLDAQYGMTQQGDAEEYNISGLMGTNFADGRGNVTVSFSKQNREAALRIDRGYFRDFWQDPNTGGTEFFPDFAAYSPLFDNPTGQPALDGIFSQAAPGAIPPGTRIYFNPDGTAFTGFFFSEVPAGVYRFNPPAEPNADLKWKVDSRGLLGQNWIGEQLVFPLDRSNFLLRGNYDINDRVGFFVQGMFNKSRADTRQQPAPAANGWSANIPVDGRAVPAELAALLASRANPTGEWQSQQYLDFIDDRTSRTDVFTYNLLAGLQGRLGDDWTWEIFGQEGESETHAYQTGFASLQRYREIIRAPNWGQGFSYQGNPSQGGFGGSTGTCTSGLNPFMPKENISQDCKDAIKADIKSRSTMEQTIWEANIQGPVVNLPGGELRTALGATYRKNDYEFINDTLTTQGSSFLDQAIGLYPSGNSTGEITVKEIYGEFLVPIFEGVELELGARNSDYNTTGNSFTWKALASWQMTDWMRIRGGFNKAERAPNIGELYLALQQTFGFAPGGDVCSLNNLQAWSANPVTNPTSSAQVEQLCRTLMNASGDPTTGDNFYNTPERQTVGGGFVFPSTKGNPDLQPETAETWTGGIVFSSPWDSPSLSRLTAIFDYYRIAVKDAIGVQSYDLAQRFCFDDDFNPTFDPSTASCQNITRNIGDGALGDVVGTYVNSGRFLTSGVDAQINWAMDVGPGTVGFNTSVNYLIEMKSAVLPVDPLVDYAGTAGNADNGLNGNFFRWKSLTSLSYGMNNWNLALSWQHLPKLKPVQAATDPDTTFESAASFDLFSLNGSIVVSDRATVRFGIENLFDADPPIAGRNGAPPPGQLAGGAPAVGSYDALGRRFYLGAKVNF